MNTVVSEALATGLPVIATNHSGLPEQVIDGMNGAIVAEGDFEELAEKILAMMEIPHSWPKFGRFGRKHVDENYNRTRLITRQINYYLESLTREHP